MKNAFAFVHRQWERLVFAVQWLFDFARRLWNFWGPRLCDRNFVAMAFINVAALNIVDPAALKWWEIAVWVGANLFFRVWDNLPDEGLQPSGVRPAGGPGVR